MNQYHLEIRSQHAKTGRSGFSGPDTYVAVQIVPEGVKKLYYLNESHAAKRGIKIHYFGQGYAEHRGPKSALGLAIKRAEQFIQELTQVKK